MCQMLRLELEISDAFDRQSHPPDNLTDLILLLSNLMVQV